MFILFVLHAFVLQGLGAEVASPSLTTPTALAPGSLLVLRAGQTFMLTCIGRRNPTSLSWDVKLDPGHMPAQDSFSVESQKNETATVLRQTWALPAHSGCYTCREKGQGASSVTVVVYEEPTCTSSMRMDWLSKNAFVDLSCRVAINSAAGGQISWTRFYGGFPWQQNTIRTPKEIIIWARINTSQIKENDVFGCEGLIVNEPISCRFPPAAFEPPAFWFLIACGLVPMLVLSALAIYISTRTFYKVLRAKKQLKA